jgi:hypothetical protein
MDHHVMFVDGDRHAVHLYAEISRLISPVPQIFRNIYKMFFRIIPYCRRIQKTGHHPYGGEMVNAITP